ncbi:type II secretion system F family protein [Catellatospora citrea]|uniref:type II secretion system F family protein n=1 Tax=Catellatospora citrea TaxID=53366 RepID=UPI0033F3E0AC
MNPGIGIGAGIGLGLAVIAWGLFPPTRPLADVLARRDDGLRSRRDMLVDRLQARGWPTPKLLDDLRVCDTDPAGHVARQLTYALAGLATPAALAVAANAIGIRLDWLLPAWLCAAGAVTAFMIPTWRVRGQARQRREEMTHTLTALLDLIGPALAAGAGVEQAMRDGAGIAQGWAADRIRDALHRARLGYLPLWQPLDDLGAHLGVVELRQLATSLRLAADEGTRIRDAIAVRADALSTRQAADLETRAAADTEKMSGPLMILAALLAVFLAGAALANLTAL